LGAVLDGTQRALGRAMGLDLHRTLRALLVGTGVATSIGSSGCTAKTQPPAVCGAPQGSSSAAQGLASEDTAFALAFYPPAAAAAGSSGNVILSPYSVSATLTMVDVGAAGQTEAQIESVLHMTGDGASEAPAYAALACGVESDGSSNGNELLVANSLWAQQGFSFERTFESVLANGYGASLQQVDFEGDPAGAVTSINGWVSGETQGEIPALLQPGDVDPTTRLVLVNAIYFKGAWATAFDPSQTGPQPFTLSDGSKVSVPTMTGAVNLSTGGSKTLTVVELPYRGGALAMDFFMPALPGGLPSFEAGLTPAVLSGALATLRPTQVTLYLPKFSFTTRVALVPVLSAMGMSDVFMPNVANLSGMDGAMDLYVSAVVQEALVEVDEQGTVAAAATAAVTDDAAGESEPSPLYIDQPFLFVIRDTQSGGILFMGHVTDPRD
jgi:serpin B